MASGLVRRLELELIVLRNSELSSREYLLLTMRSGLITLTADIPVPDFAIPYAAPKLLNIIATLQPIVPKKDCEMLIMS